MYIKKILLLCVAISLVIGAVFSYNVYHKVFSDNTQFSESVAEVYIPTGADFNRVVEIITPLINDVDSFTWLAQKKGYAKNVKAGRYKLVKGSNSNDLIDNLRSKNIPVKVSFNNQERLENLAGRVSKQIEADSISLLRVFKDSVFLKENNFTADTAISMYIPNSYEFFWNISAEGFRDKMQKESIRFWNKKRMNKLEEIGLKPVEVMTLASIVHKESVKIAERPRIAGVYMNRLIHGWKLDADPTVIYTIKKLNNNWDSVIRRVLYKDLALEHPYNTYRNKGLPPGPIAMPDISAIDAVLNYEKHDYFYFVADVKKFGFHKFATSLTQHNRNSSEYHSWANNKKIRR